MAWKVARTLNILVREQFMIEELQKQQQDMTQRIERIRGFL
jgi:hypothetical protein